MGKTVPTYRKALEKEIKSWKEFRKALRKEERKAFDKLIESCKHHTSAGSQAKKPDPFQAMFMSILLDHQKEITDLREEIEEIREYLEEE